MTQNFNPSDLVRQCREALELANRAAQTAVKLAQELDTCANRLDALEQTNQALAKTIMCQAEEKAATERRIVELEYFMPILRAKFATALGPDIPEISETTVERYRNGENELDSKPMERDARGSYDAAR